MSAILITYLLLWTVTVSTQTVQPSTTQAINKDTTYNAFTIQWKPQTCYKNAHPSCFSDVIPNITIHGIWPNYYSGWFPSDCPGNELEYKQIQHLETELEIYWAALILPIDGGFPNFEFWSHEWAKHGTCWHYVNVTQYFEYALSWIKNDYNNIENILATDNIYPSSKQTYSLSQVTESISMGLNQKVVLRCIAKRFISEFWVCRDWFGDKIDCPDVLPSNCDDTVVLTVQIPPDIYTTTTTQTTAVRTTINDDSHSDSGDSVSDDSVSEDDVIINNENHDGKPLKIFSKDVDSYTICVVILIVVIVLVLGCIACYSYLITKNETHQKIKINMEDIDD
eukprot:959204_1